MKQKFEITGMTCSACSSSIQKSVSKIEGVNKAEVNLLTKEMIVEYDNNKNLKATVIEKVNKLGYQAQLIEKQTKNHTMPTENLFKKEAKELKNRLIVSLVFLLPLMYISMGHMLGLPFLTFFENHNNALAFAFTQFLLTLPILYVNRNYFISGFKHIFTLKPNMDSLIAIGSFAAVVYGIVSIYVIGNATAFANHSVIETYVNNLYFETAGTILTLITLGKFLEAKAKNKTNDALEKLMDLAPKTAIILIENKEVEVHIEDIKLNDIIVIKSGQILPVDGVVVWGEGTVDQSAITGESIPEYKTTNQKVYAGTTNLNGYFHFKATSVGEDTTLSKIIELVKQASASKAPISKLADKISGVFVPIVFAISLISFITWLALGYGLEHSLSILISVLVISCPCALGLATPVAIMVGTGLAAKNNILIKSAEALETLHKVDTILFDKTGTITEGKPKVTDIHFIKSLTETQFLEICYSLEKPSEHPLAKAIVNFAEEKNIKLQDTTEFKSILGHGVSAKSLETTYFAGNKKLLSDNNIDIHPFEKTFKELSNQGKTVMFFATQNEVLGLIAVADTVKENSKKAIETIKKMGIEVVMLTGDNDAVAKHITKLVEIEKVYSNVLPQDKQQYVKDLQNQGKIVAMVGDGINDSPALAKADVGIAIGTGTDIAIDSADIVLVKSDIADVVKAIKLSKKTLTNIKQNLFWAFIYNILGIPIAAGAFYGIFNLTLNPMLAAGAMSLSSLFVVGNALRLKIFKPKL